MSAFLHGLGAQLGLLAGRRRHRLMLLLFLGASALSAATYRQGAMRELPVAVYDADGTGLSRTVLRSLDATPELRVVTDPPPTLDGAERALVRGELCAVVLLPDGFTADVKRGRRAQVLVAADLGQRPHRQDRAAGRGPGARHRRGGRGGERGGEAGHPAVRGAGAGPAHHRHRRVPREPRGELRSLRRAALRPLLRPAPGVLPGLGGALAGGAGPARGRDPGPVRGLPLRRRGRGAGGGLRRPLAGRPLAGELLPGGGAPAPLRWWRRTSSSRRPSRRCSAEGCSPSSSPCSWGCSRSCSPG